MRRASEALWTCARTLTLVSGLLGPWLAAHAQEGIAQEHGWAGFWWGGQVLVTSGFPMTVTDGTGDRRYGMGAGLGLRVGYDHQGVLGLFLAAELNVEREGPYRSLGGGARVMFPVGRAFRLGATAGARFIDSAPTLPFVTGGALMEWPVSRRLGMALEVDRAWPVGGAHGRNTGAGTRQQVEAGSGPWRGLLSLTWYFPRE